MIKRKYLSNRRQGSAALIVTVAISAVLIVLFVGITTIATREISKSINADQANRALYAAEAGVEDGIRRLSADPSLTEPTCNATNGANGAEVPVITGDAGSQGTSAWTCRTITQQSRDITGHLNKDETLQLNISRARTGQSATAPLSLVQFMTVEWNDPTVDSPTPYVPSPTLTSYLPISLLNNNTAWGGRAAALELTGVWLPTTINQGTLNSTGGVLPTRTVVASPVSPGTYQDFSPWNGGSGCATTLTPNNTNAQTCFPGADYNASGVARGSLRSNISASCTNGAASYNCKIPDAANFANKYNLDQLMKTEYDTGGASVTQSSGNLNNPLFLRIKARYAGTSYRLKFYDASGAQVFMPDGYATIDVTARSGDYFRRVVAKKLLQPTVYDGVFDNAIFSGGAVCKTMSIYKDFRGAPDYSQVSDGAGGWTRQVNADAGRNQGCGDPNT